MENYTRDAAECHCYTNIVRNEMRLTFEQVHPIYELIQLVRFTMLQDISMG